VPRTGSPAADRLPGCLVTDKWLLLLLLLVVVVVVVSSWHHHEHGLPHRVRRDIDLRPDDTRRSRATPGAPRRSLAIPCRWSKTIPGAPWRHRAFSDNTRRPKVFPGDARSPKTIPGAPGRPASAQAGRRCVWCEPFPLFRADAAARPPPCQIASTPIYYAKYIPESLSNTVVHRPSVRATEMSEAHTPRSTYFDLLWIRGTVCAC